MSRSRWLSLLRCRVAILRRSLVALRRSSEGGLPHAAKTAPSEGQVTTAQAGEPRTSYRIWKLAGALYDTTKYSLTSLPLYLFSLARNWFCMPSPFLKLSSAQSTLWHSLDNAQGTSYPPFWLGRTLSCMGTRKAPLSSSRPTVLDFRKPLPSSFQSRASRGWHSITMPLVGTFASY